MTEDMMQLKRRLARLLVEKSYREGDFVLAPAVAATTISIAG